MDSINITGLSATGFHGVFPEERRNGQLFVVDVTLGLGRRGTAVAAVTDSLNDAIDYGKVAASVIADELSDTVDYAGIADLIRAEIEGEPCRLIETLAGRIADRCLSNSLVQQVRVTVHKPQAPVPHELSDLSVTITRSSHEQRSL